MEVTIVVVSEAVVVILRLTTSLHLKGEENLVHHKHTETPATLRQ
jgi:hypothetical protein